MMATVPAVQMVVMLGDGNNSADGCDVAHSGRWCG